MFTESKKTKQFTDIPSQNIIAQTTKIVGDFNSKGDFRIDGIVEGNIKTTGKVVIGKAGFVKGTMQAAEVYIEGKFAGKLTVLGTLTLKTLGHVEGEVIIEKLAVEPGATFNVTCVMKGAVKEINNGEQQHTTETEKTA